MYIYKTRTVLGKILARNRSYTQIRINWALFNKEIIFKDYGKDIWKP